MYVIQGNELSQGLKKQNTRNQTWLILNLVFGLVSIDGALSDHFTGGRSIFRTVLGDERIRKIRGAD